MRALRSLVVAACLLASSTACWGATAADSDPQPTRESILALLDAAQVDGLRVRPTHSLLERFRALGAPAEEVLRHELLRAEGERYRNTQLITELLVELGSPEGDDGR